MTCGGAILFLTLVTACLCVNTRQYSFSGSNLVFTWDESSSSAFFLGKQTLNGGEAAWFRFDVTKNVAGGGVQLTSGWSPPTANASFTRSAESPPIVMDSIYIVDGSVPFSTYANMTSLASVVKTVYNVTHVDGCLLVVEGTLNNVPYLQVTFQSNPADVHQLIIKANILASNVLFQNRTVGPSDMKMDLGIVSSSPPPNTRFAVPTRWYGVTPPLFASSDTSSGPSVLNPTLDDLWGVKADASPTFTRWWWVCAKSDTLGNDIITRAFPVSGQPWANFFGFFKPISPTSVWWDPALSVVVGTPQPESVNVGLIVGVTIGAVALGVLIALLIVVLTKKSIASKTENARRNIRASTIDDMSRLRQSSNDIK